MSVSLLDYLRGKRHITDRAVRVREIFESMGGTGIKMGQQLAVRVDVLPFEVCQELGTLMDSVPPFPTAYAIKRIEQISGRSLSEVFQEFIEEPIGAASVACVFKARLASGEWVAVKVQRPKVGQQFMADLRVVGWVTWMMEVLTVVRAGFFKNFRLELSEMFLDELDFYKEANCTTLFR